MKAKAKRTIARQIPKLICKLCGSTYEPAKPQNYEYNKFRKFCSEECRHRASYEKRLQTLAAKKVVVQIETRRRVASSSSINIYRQVHEAACKFAGMTKEDYGYGSDED